MGAAEYNKMTLELKSNFLWDKGTFIEERVNYGKYKICMYSLFNFYVEVFYSIKDNNIKKVNALESDIDWHGYMESINLKHLLR